MRLNKSSEDELHTEPVLCTYDVPSTLQNYCTGLITTRGFHFELKEIFSPVVKLHFLLYGSCVKEYIPLSHFAKKAI